MSTSTTCKGTGQQAGGPHEPGSQHGAVLRVLIYEPYIFDVYGNTRYLLSLFRYYNRERFQLLLVSPYEHPFLDMIRALKGEVIVVRPPEKLTRYGGQITDDNIIGKGRTLLSLIRFGRVLKKLVRDHSIDIVQCHSVRSLMMIGWVSRLLHRPVIWYIKGDLANGLLDRLGFLIATRIFFQSPLTRDRRYPWLRRFFSKKIGIIPNGIDLSELAQIGEEARSAVRRELNIQSDRVNIICLGQISPLKGSDIMIEALARLKQSQRTFHCYFVGDPVLEKYKSFYRVLLDRVRELGLQNDVTFTGWRRDATVILSQMDLLVHPSLTEGVPKAVMEAMALGVPVIASNVGGTAELVISGRTGTLIPSNSQKALEEALIQTIDSATLRATMADSASKLIHEHYSVTNNVNCLEYIYQELASR